MEYYNLLLGLGERAEKFWTESIKEGLNNRYLYDVEDIYKLRSIFRDHKNQMRLLEVSIQP